MILNPVYCGKASVTVPLQGVSTLLTLQVCDLATVEIHISELSRVKGELIGNIQLPAGSRVVCVARNGEPVVDLDALFLAENDIVYVLSNDEHAVRQLFEF